MKTSQYLSTFLLAGIASIASAQTDPNAVLHKTIEVDGVEVFYREAGSKEKPTILLLHGFPTSSHMFRNLIHDLKDNFHLVAPDYPGYGQSEQPSMEDFEYSFDSFAELVLEFTEKLELESYSLYLMDYGAPIGFRLATAHPERVETLIVQNGNAYIEGITDFWNPIKAYWADPSAENAATLRGFLTEDVTRWQYVDGTRNPEAISPDNWAADMLHLSRGGNQEIQLAMFYDYQNNITLYPEWQSYLREHQPPTLVTWGKNDVIFPASGAYPYLQDLEQIDFHLLNTGHFALEEDGALIANLISEFIPRYVR